MEETNPQDSAQSPQTGAAPSEPAAQPAPTSEQQTTPSEPQQTAGGQQTSVLAIISLIVSFLLGPIGLILGIIALVQINKDPNLKGKGLAIAAIVIGSLGLVLVFLMMVGSLAYFGVLSPDKFLSERCSMQPGFACLDFAYADGSVEIRMQNAIGYELQEFELSLNGHACSPSSISIANGRTQTFTCPVTGAGDMFSGDFSMLYLNPNTGMKHTGSGVIMFKI